MRTMTREEAMTRTEGRGDAAIVPRDQIGGTAWISQASH